MSRPGYMYMYAAPADPDLSVREPQQVHPREVELLPDKAAIADWHDQRRDAVWGDYDIVWTMSSKQLAALKAGGALVVCLDSETGGQILLRLDEVVYG